MNTRKIMCAALLVLVPLAAEAGKTVTIDSQAVLTIRGERIQPPFNVVMTDTNVTVNGREVGNLRDMFPKPWTFESIPDPDSLDYINWLVVNVMTRAESLLVAGATNDEIAQFMRAWLEDHVKQSKTVSLADPDEGLWLHYSLWNKEDRVGIPMPMKPQEPPDPQESLNTIFRNIINALRAGKRIEVTSGALYIGDRRERSCEQPDQ